MVGDLITLTTTPPKTSNVEAKITVGSTTATLDLKLFISPPAEIAKKAIILGSQQLPIFLGYNTSPDISSLANQIGLFKVVKTLNPNLDFILNVVSSISSMSSSKPIVRFYRLTPGTKLNYNSPVAVGARFQVNGFAPITKTMYVQLAG